MRLALRRWDHRKSPIDRVIYTLALGDDRSLNDYARARFFKLEPAEVRVVTRFLELAVEHDAICDARAAGQALDKYWRRAVTKLDPAD